MKIEYKFIYAHNEFITACKQGNLESAKLYLKNGADIHAMNDYALRWASNNGHLEVVAYLKNQIRKEKIALLT